MKFKNFAKKLSLFLFVALGAFPVQADNNQAFNLVASGMNLKQTIGKTLVAATRDSGKIWYLYLDPNGAANFTFSTGNKVDATWEIHNNRYICFKGLVDEDPEKEICKFTPSRGRGMDWRTVEKKPGRTNWSYVDSKAYAGSSQVFLALDGKVDVPQGDLKSELGSIAGKVVAYRKIGLIDTKATYLTHYDADGTWTRVDADGRFERGVYTYDGKQLCVDHSHSPKDYFCATFLEADGRIVLRPKSGAGRDVLFAMPFEISSPRLVQSLTKNWAHMIVPTHGRTRFALVDNAYAVKDRAVFVFDLESGLKLGSAPGAVRDLAFSNDDKHLATASKTLLRMFSTELMRERWSDNGTDQKGFTEVAFSADNQIVYAGTLTGDVIAYNAETGTELERASFGPNAIDDINVTNGVVLVTHGDHFITAASETDLSQTVDHVIIDDRLTSFVTTGENSVVAVYAKKGIVAQLIVASAQDITLEKKTQVNMGRTSYFDLSPDRSKAIVTAHEGIKIYSWPDMIEETVFGNDVFGSQGFSTFIGAGNRILTSALGRPGAAIWAFDDAIAGKIYANNAAALKSFRIAKKQIFAANKAIKDRETSQLAALEKSYADHDCDTFEKLLGAYFSPYERDVVSCRRLAEREQTKTIYGEMLARLNCAEAKAFRIEKKLSTANEERICFKTVERNQLEADYGGALAAGDCTVVGELGKQLGKADAGRTCFISTALNLETAQSAYIAAVRFDTSGDKEAAKIVYLSILENFPNESVSIDAANRLTALSDLETLQNKQAETDQALIAMQKALEEARRDASNAASRAVAAQAKAAESRRQAEQARARETQATQRAAQAQSSQNRRNSACDHVAPGMYFEFKGGGFLGVANGRWVVIGISRSGGFVTARKTGQDFQRQIPCSKVY